MYFDEPGERFDAMPPGVQLVLAVISIFVVLFWLVPAPLVDAAGAARARCSDVQLSPEAESAGYRLVSLEATDSTNDDACQAARRGRSGPALDHRREQRAGRGRHGRQWSSPQGNLYASLLLIDPCELAAAPQLGFRGRLALHEAVEAVTGIGAPRLSL